MTDRALGIALADLESTAEGRWPDSFGGIWAAGDAADAKVFVSFTDEAAQRVESLARDFSDPDRLVPVRVSRSLAELQELQLELVADRDAARDGANLVGGLDGANYDLDVDRENNSVVMIVPSGSGDRLTEIREEVDARYGGGVVVEAGQVAQQFGCTDRFHCGLQLRAGIGSRFYIAGTQTASSCSDGFVVVRTGGAIQILSAAHCGDHANGNPDIGNGRYHRGSIIPANLYGSVQDQYEGGRVDAERHSIGNGFSGNPWIYLTESVQAGPIKSVGTWGGIVVNSTNLCKAGSGSGYSCGTVRSKEYSPGYLPGANRFLGVEAFAEPGDSGAPFVQSSTQAEAILSGGGGGACGCWTIAGHIEYADEKLGVTPKIAP